MKKKIEGFAKKQKKVFKSGKNKGNIKTLPLAESLELTRYKLEGFLKEQKHLEEVKKAFKEALEKDASVASIK